MFIARYKHTVPIGRIVANHIVALTIVLSFIASLVPIASASASKSNAMPCCVGNDAGHCESGIAAPKVSIPEPEPMCGLTTAEPAVDADTIVAEPSKKPSQHSHRQTAQSGASNPAIASSQSAAKSALSHPCHTDCCAGVSGLARNQRERGTEQSNFLRSSTPRELLYLNGGPLLFLSAADWEQISPRGPPILSSRYL